MKLSYRKRIIIWYSLLSLFFFIAAIQLFKIQVIKSNDIVTIAKKQFFKRPITLRGDIRDRSGNLLVLDVITYELYNNSNGIDLISQINIEKLAGLLGIPFEDLKKKLQQRKNTRILSNINKETAKKIKELNIDFVYLVPTVKRTYPHKKMAAHIIGFVNKDFKGQHGVEYSHEGLITMIIENSTYHDLYPKGANIVLTIDAILQQYADDELNKAVEKSKAERGAIIVLSPKTGEILAWAVYPTFDPNIFYKEKSLKNWSLTDIYQPGSTFKVITVASALENMTIQSNSKFYDPGFIKVVNRMIRNHHKTKPKYLSLLELFKESSNVAATQVGLTMKPRLFYDSIKKFMIGEKTKIDLPGESNGLLLNHSKWKLIDTATTSFGQGAVSVTPLQLASAIAAIANHGTWVQPHILKGVWDSTFNIINQPPYEIVTRQAVSRETADLVSTLLKQSVSENLKTMAYIAGNVPGYKVAGKTGTAQKIRSDGKGYLSGHTVASFIGYLPADNPEILALVVIDDPKIGGGWGNTVCGPVFNNVAKMAAKRFIENI